MTKLLIFISVLVLGVSVAWWEGFAPVNMEERQREAAGMTELSTPAPLARFIDLAGNERTVQDFRGKVVLLNFWATWCAPCVVEMPQLLKLAEREKDRLVFIALSVDDSPEEIEKFLQTFPDNVRERLELENVVIGLDTDKHISKNLYGTTMYPETYVIDTDMMVRHKIEGIVEWLSEDIEQLIFGTEKG